MSSTSAVVSFIEAKVVPAPAVITLAGKVAIVTGASRGIGQGIALALARDGAKVVVNYLSDKKSAEATVAAINSVTPNTAIAVQADVTRSDDVDRLFAEAKSAFGGKIDIVVANSGIAGASSIATTSNEEFDRIINTNLKGVFYTLRAAANNISDNGRIIVIGSTAKTGMSVGFAPYAASKAAVEVLANTLAQELGSRGITVNTVHPGGTLTDLIKGAGDAVLEVAKKMSPMNRIGTPADIGDAVALLAAESARWISGQAINVSGAGKST